MIIYPTDEGAIEIGDYDDDGEVVLAVTNTCNETAEIYLNEAELIVIRDRINELLNNK